MCRIGTHPVRPVRPRKWSLGARSGVPSTTHGALGGDSARMSRTRAPDWDTPGASPEMVLEGAVGGSLGGDSARTSRARALDWDTPGASPERVPGGAVGGLTFPRAGGQDDVSSTETPSNYPGGPAEAIRDCLLGVVYAQP